MPGSAALQTLQGQDEQKPFPLEMSSTVTAVHGEKLDVPLDPHSREQAESLPTAILFVWSSDKSLPNSTACPNNPITIHTKNKKKQLAKSQ